LNLKKYIKPLEPPDIIHLQATEGWLESGNHFEANEELEQITLELEPISTSWVCLQPG